MPWISKNKPSELGLQYYPNFEGLGFPEVVIAFLNGLKKKDGEMEPTVSKIWKLQPPRIHQEVGRTRCKSRCCPARAGRSSGSRQPTGRDERGSGHEGETLQDPRCDRPDDSVQLGANLCARRNRCPPSSPTWSVLANRGTAAICDCFGHLSCFSFKRGGCQSLRYYSPLARNLNPGDGIYLVVAAAKASSIPIVWTISFVTCVN